MNKTLISILTVASFTSLFSVTALSAPVANLKVMGDIKPPTCTVNGSSETELFYNFDNISPSVIPQDSPYNGLQSLSNNLTVTCDAATFLTFKATDVYAADLSNFIVSGASQNRASAFVLTDNSDKSKQVGIISFGWSKVFVDGDIAYLSRANDGQYNPSSYSGSEVLVRNATNAWTSESQREVAPSELALKSGKSFAATIHNYRYLGVRGAAGMYLLSKSDLEKNDVDLSGQVDYVGQVILTFNFGI
ncbi:type 1 fimbria pilin [Providencia alcalifaciens]|nr:type 1 fimbria pilin [Providencia alcalifaciens]